MCDRPVRDLALCRVTLPTRCPPLHRTVLPMLARVRSAAVLGIDAYLVDVETDIANGLPTFVTVGLPQGAVDRKSTRLNSSHLGISYAVFCLKKKKRRAFALAVAVNGQRSAHFLGREKSAV